MVGAPQPPVPNVSPIQVGDEQHGLDQTGGRVLDPSPEAVDAPALVDDGEGGAAGSAFQELGGVMDALMPGKGMCSAGAGRRDRSDRAEREEGYKLRW
jgi:hypothetical protein